MPAYSPAAIILNQVRSIQQICRLYGLVSVPGENPGMGRSSQGDSQSPGAKMEIVGGGGVAWSWGDACGSID